MLYEVITLGSIRIRKVVATILGTAVSMAEATPNQAEEILRGTLRGIRSGLVRSLARFKKQLLFMPEDVITSYSIHYTKLYDNGIVNFNGHYKEAGLGETGKSYLVGRDMKMRSNSRFMEQNADTIVSAMHTDITFSDATSDASKTALSGHSGSMATTDYRGNAVLSSYDFIDLSDTRWGIIVEINEDEALAELSSMRRVIWIIFALILFVMVVIAIFMIQKLVLSKLSVLQEAAHGLSQGEGDLTRKIVVRNNFV